MYRTRMVRPRRNDPTPWLKAIAEIPFVRSVVESKAGAGARGKSGRPDDPFDGELKLATTVGVRRVAFDVRSSHLDYAALHGFAARAGAAKHSAILLAPHVGTPIARKMQELDLNYADLAGNLRLRIDGAGVAVVEGRRSEIRRSVGPMRSAGWWAVFALVVRDDGVVPSVRELATAAGVSKSAAAAALVRLSAEGHLAGRPPRLSSQHRARLAERWIEAYRTVLRPAAVFGRFQGAATGEALEAAIVRAFDGRRFAFGGTTGAYRSVPHYRGSETMIFAPEFDETDRLRLRVLPAQDGHLHVLRIAAPAAYLNDSPDGAHPLLLYAELSAVDDDRAHEAAAELAKIRLPWLR